MTILKGHLAVTRIFPLSLVSALLLTLSICSCVDTSTLTLDTSLKKDRYEAMGGGIHLDMSYGLERARTFLGVQASGQRGSVEIELNKDYADLQTYYSKSSIAAREGSLRKLQPVVYNGNPRAFYTEYYDSPFKRYRMALVVETDEKTYHIKGFHRLDEGDPLTNTMRSIIQRVHIEAYQEIVKPFSKAHILQDLTNKVYSRDNLYPTEETDEAYMQYTVLPYNKTDISTICREQLAKFAKTDAILETIEVDNGEMMTGMVMDGKRSALVVVTKSKQENQTTIVECYGNEKLDLGEMKTKILSDFLTVL